MKRIEHEGACDPGDVPDRELTVPVVGAADGPEMKRERKRERDGERGEPDDDKRELTPAAEIHNLNHEGTKTRSLEKHPS
jgi:hypothetical protein